MRKIYVIILLFVSVLPMKGQTQADYASTWAGGWKYAFSEEGRNNWKPEFTVRWSTGLYADGPIVTGGVRIDDKRTFGLLVGHGRSKVYANSTPCHTYHIETAAYMRRYFHFGKRDIVALYSDACIGASWVYKATADFGDVNPGAKPGDVGFYASWDPGVRVRLYKNLHLFLGPTIATNCIGYHLGLGF